MIRFIAVFLISLVLPAADAQTRASLRGLTNFANTEGRVVFEAWGDSTTERDGGGHSGGFAAGFYGVAPAAGVLIPVNHSSGASETHGYFAARRRDNSGTRIGVFNSVDLLASAGYPTSLKSAGIQIPISGTWQGPQVGYLGSSTIADGGDGITNSQTSIIVADASSFPASGLVKIGSEIVNYTGKTANTLTGCTRGHLSTTAATAAEGATVLAGTNSGTFGGLIYRDHPMGFGGDLRSCVYYVSVSASSVTGATVTPGITSQANPYTSDFGWTTLATGSATNMTGTAVGTVGRAQVSLAAGYRGSVSMQIGATTANGQGPWGPAAVTYTGLFFNSRPFGPVQAMGINQGGKRINELYRELRLYDAATATVEFDTGLLTRYKTYLTVGDAAVGGNGAVGLCQVTCTGHNEAGGGWYNALVDPTEAWTIAYTGTLAGNIDASTTTIALVSAAGLNSGGGHVLIGNERIAYGAVSGNSLTGCTRGVYGTVAATHTTAEPVYAGYLLQHPLGLVTDILYDYKLKLSTWIAAGGSSNRFWYVWVRPVPVSASPVYLSWTQGVSSNAEKEGRMIEYAAAVNGRLVGREGFVLADTTRVWGGGETTTYQWGADASDVTHNTTAAYEFTWRKLFGLDVYGPAPVVRGRSTP